MPKYLTNVATREQRGAPIRRPDYRGPVRPPLPANDNVRSLPPLTRAAVGAIGWLGPMGRGFNFGWHLGQYLWDEFPQTHPWTEGGQAGLMSRPQWRVDTRYWDASPECRTGGGVARVPAMAMNPSNCSSVHYDLFPWWAVRQEADPAWTYFDRSVVDGAIAAKGASSFSLLTYSHPGSDDMRWHTHDVVYVRKSGAPTNALVYDPRTLPYSPVPVTFPVAFPLASPIAVPMTRPMVQPESTEGSEPSNKPEQDPNHREQEKPRYDLPALPGVPFIAVPPHIGDVIHVQPPTTVIEGFSPAPGGQVNVHFTTEPGRPTDAVPPGGRKKKQKKTNVAIAGGIIWTGINTATEVMDFIKAMHESIPDGPHKLSKKASKAQIIEYMLTNLEPWGHVDVAEALQNYIQMQVGDFVAALGGQQIKKVSQELGLVTGLDRAIRLMGDGLSDLTGQDTWYAHERGKNLGDLVPELDIDMVTGAVSLRSKWGDLTWKW